MNKMIIFDLDGVLIDSKDLHFQCLNKALGEIDSSFIITKDEHLSKYNGLNTRAKLNLLHLEKGLDPIYFNQIWANKQAATAIIIEHYNKNPNLIDLFKFISNTGTKISVASNSIRKTVQLSLLKLGVLEYVDFFVSSEDVLRPKPFPEMHWKCMTILDTLPTDTVIIEDSYIGKLAAVSSGAHLLPVNSHNDVTFELLSSALEIIGVR